MLRTRLSGFTLAELLIALAILGVIATFTIPKIVQSQQGGRSNSIAKESAGVVSEAYQLLRSKGQASANTIMPDLLANMNYVKQETSGSIDPEPNNGTPYACGTQITCYRLHNGAILWLWDLSPSFSPFGGTTNLHALNYCIDPDGKQAGSPPADGPSMSVCFVLYYNGKITTYDTSLPNTNYNGFIQTLTGGGYDPSWFKW